MKKPTTKTTATTAKKTTKKPAKNPPRCPICASDRLFLARDTCAGAQFVTRPGVCLSCGAPLVITSRVANFR